MVLGCRAGSKRDLIDRKGPAMKAAVVHDFSQPLRIEDIPIPELGIGEVVVKVETCGVCHTDIHAAHGDWPVKPAPPFVPGHEGVGRVARLGPEVRGVREGDRVAIPWLGWACGACEYCASGRETLCPNQQMTGYTVNGSYAEYVKANAAFVGHVPDEIDPLDAAPLTCAGVTTYKEVKVSGARSSDLVAAFEQAYRSLKRGGTLVFVALPAENHMDLPIFETVLGGSRSWGRSSAPGWTWPRPSNCMPKGAPGSCGRPVGSRRSTRPSSRSRRPRSTPASSSISGRDRLPARSACANRISP
jgi:D-arabinose 1-dehydrogenase-like Zn-dependent alcohol dehydrogenase